MTEMIEARLRAFEVQLGEVLDRVRACAWLLKEVEDDDLRFLIAERLPALGSSIVPELNKILGDRSCSPSVKYLAAWVAVEVGDRGDSIHVLCEEIKAGSEWALPAAGVLGRHGITEGRDPVLLALERVDPKDGVAVLGYTTALRELNGDLPDRVRRRLESESDHWVAKAVSDDFPS